MLADTGEIPPEQIADTLEALEGDVREKAVRSRRSPRTWTRPPRPCARPAKAMLARADRIEKRAETVRAYLLFHMQACGISKIECPWFTLPCARIRPSVVIDDEAQIPVGLLRAAPAARAEARQGRGKARHPAGTDVPGAICCNPKDWRYVNELQSNRNYAGARLDTHGA